MSAAEVEKSRMSYADECVEFVLITPDESGQDYDGDGCQHGYVQSNKDNSSMERVHAGRITVNCEAIGCCSKASRNHPRALSQAKPI